MPLPKGGSAVIGEHSPKSFFAGVLGSGVIWKCYILDAVLQKSIPPGGRDRLMYSFSPSGLSPTTPSLQALENVARGPGCNSALSKTDHS